MAIARYVALTDHAVERFKERLGREGMPDIEARRQLIEMLNHGTYVEQPPEWALPIDPSNTGYLMLGDDVCFVLRGRALVTCLTKGNMTPATRAYRKRRKRDRRASRAARRGC